MIAVTAILAEMHPRSFGLAQGCGKIGPCLATEPLEVDTSAEPQQSASRKNGTLPVHAS
jgi:hypothetical protein